MSCSDWSSVVDFYDELAGDYHLVYADQWEGSLRRQGEAIDALIRSRLTGARSVLDCSCGVGTQAIGLSIRGYHVTGTDISERSLTRAMRTARELEVPLQTVTADFRDLTGVPGEFDVVVSCDNAVPHLLTEAEIDVALTQMHNKLRPGGLLVISTRDYERALVERPRSAAPLDVPGPPRRIVVRMHEWDAPDSRLYTVRFLIMTKKQGGWHVADHATRYRAVRPDELVESAMRAGLRDIRWHTAAEARFHQPVMVARRPG